MSRNKVRLSDVVNSYMAAREHEDYDSYTPYLTVMQHGKQALRELVRRLGGSSIKSLRLDVTDGLVDFPNDFLDYSKVGFIDSNGEVELIGRNDKLNISQDILEDSFGNKLLDSDGYVLTTRTPKTGVAESSSGSDWYYGSLWLNNYYGGDVYNSYGSVRTNPYGDYRVDYDNQRFEFSSNMVKTEIILEYTSDPSMMSDPLFDQRLEQAVRQYIYWKNIQRKSNVPSNEKLFAKNNFKAERKIAQSQIKSFTLEEAVFALKVGNKQIKM